MVVVLVVCTLRHATTFTWQTFDQILTPIKSCLASLSLIWPLYSATSQPHKSAVSVYGIQLVVATYSHRCCNGYGGLKTYLPLLLQPAHGITTHALRTQIIAASSSLSIVREGAPVTVHPLTPEVSFRISSNNKTKLGRIATNRLNSAPANPLLQVLHHRVVVVVVLHSTHNNCTQCNKK